MVFRLISLRNVSTTLMAMREIMKNNLIHTDIKPENLLLSGITYTDESIIKSIASDEFNKKVKDCLEIN